MADYAGQGNGLMHKSFGHDRLKIVESYIAPVDMQVDGTLVGKGSWLMSTVILDDTIWKSVKEGKITGYSIRGRSHATEET